MSHERLRIAFCIAVASLVVPSAVQMSAQPAARRGATSAALITFAGFYQSQPVVVRGMLVTRDQPVLISQTIDRAIPLLFTGSSPIDGPIELRATFWDLGRLPREDPRVVTLGLERLLAKGSESEWPRPGEIVALVVTDAMAIKPASGEPTLRQIALEPASYVGKRVRIAGQFRGRNLYGDLPQGPGLSQWDFVLRAADSAVWVTGLRPRGRGFNLNPGARVDTGNWLEAIGVVKEGKGLVWIEAQGLALTKPDLEIRNAETPPIPQMGPPPEVIFSDPAEGELDVPLKAAIRFQFSRDMNPDTFKEHVRWRYTAADAVNVGATTPREAARSPQFKYDRARRALEIQLAPDESAPYRDVVIELLDGIAATDGAKLKPWSLTFSFGGQ
jgi:Bacterial Ig-like domain